MDDLKRLDIHKAKELVDTKNLYIVDVRDPASFEDGHLENALYLTDQGIEAFLKSADKEKPVLCYCYHGNNSQMAALFFLENGFKSVYSMDGGFEEWKQSYPTVTGS